MTSLFLIGSYENQKMFAFAQYKCILIACSHCATAKAKANAKLLFNDCLQPDWKLHWIYKDAIC